MRRTFLYLLAGQLASISIPIMAQEPDGLPEKVGEGSLTAAQLATIESWPTEKQSQFRSWPVDTQLYFWTLPSQRQAIFWKLREEDKSALAGMDDAAREKAWSIIEQKARGTPHKSSPDEKREPGDPEKTPQSDGR